MSTPEFTYAVQRYEAIERDHPEFIEQLGRFFRQHVSEASTASVGEEDKRFADYFIGTATETKPETVQTGKMIGAILFSAGKEFVDPLDKDSTDVPETLSGFVDLIAVEPEHRREHIATKLLKTAEATMIEQGCTVAQTIPVIADENRARMFWESQGYSLENDTDFTYSKNLTS